jgi:SpoVK/Ycf46/Vps4 family AAA+-type ATPase
MPTPAAQQNGTAPQNLSSNVAPYPSDYDYLQTELERIQTLVELRDLRHERLKAEKHSPDDWDDRQQRLEEKLDAQDKRCEARLDATRQAATDRSDADAPTLPRLEQLAAKHDLDPFERDVILVLAARRALPAIGNEFGFHFDVSDILEILARDLPTRIRARRYFYRDATLVREGIIEVDLNFGDLDFSDVEMDPRMLDYVLGLETEAAQLVEGSHLYEPSVHFDQVALPDEQEQLIVDTARHFDDFQAAQHAFGLGERLPYGNGVVMLFHGPSGTGKTMTANALANRLGKRLMLVNYDLVGGEGEMRSDQTFRFLLREARLQDAILFFDECEEVFGGRDSLLLTEIERHEGLVILATNVPQKLDEAMRRRITLSVPFERPGPDLRQEIWENLLPSAESEPTSADGPPETSGRLADDVDSRALAERYALTGGFIKNAVLAALSRAAAREGAAPVLRQEDLREGAQRQLEGRLAESDFERKVTPTCGLEALVVPEDLDASLREIVGVERSRDVLFGKWNLGEGRASTGRGVLALFHGPPGTGKTMAAEALGHELGRPLRLLTPAEVHSKFVGETSKILREAFDEAEKNDAIVFFDEADAFLSGRTGVESATDRFANSDVNELLGLIERFEGLIVLTTNLAENLDPALRRRVRYRLEFPRPAADLRERLWRQLLPESLPLAGSVDTEALAEAAELTGAEIENAVFRAAAHAVVRPGGDTSDQQRSVRQRDLLDAAHIEAENAPGATQSESVGFRAER